MLGTLTVYRGQTMTPEECAKFKKDFENKKAQIFGYMSTCQNEKMAIDHALKATSSLYGFFKDQPTLINKKDVSAARPTGIKNDFRNKDAKKPTTRTSNFASSKLQMELAK